MKPQKKWRYRLFAPLVYLAAIILLVEEWFWDIGEAMIKRIAAWPPIPALETQLKRLPPYGALAAFMLPAILLLPVKLLALYAIAHGHALWGVVVIILAKVGGAAIVARLYSLTRPTLLAVPWFARWHDKFMLFKDKMVNRLRASAAFIHVTAMVAAIKAKARAFAASMKRGRHSMRPARVIRRFVVFWRARRRRP